MTNSIFVVATLQPISTHTLTWSVTLVWNVSRTYTSISTHTLTWSVTSATRGDYHDMDISTHTLTWSVTADEHAEMWIDLNFNSHAHVERDFTDHK